MKDCLTVPRKESHSDPEWAIVMVTMTFSWRALAMVRATGPQMALAKEQEMGDASEMLLSEIEMEKTKDLPMERERASGKVSEKHGSAVMKGARMVAMNARLCPQAQRPRTQKALGHPNPQASQRRRYRVQAMRIHSACQRSTRPRCWNSIATVSLHEGKRKCHPERSMSHQTTSVHAASTTRGLH